MQVQEIVWSVTMASGGWAPLSDAAPSRSSWRNSHLLWWVIIMDYLILPLQ